MRLLLAASAIRLEKWRYNYGTKITPQRLANIKLAHSSNIEAFTVSLFGKFGRVIEASLDPYRDDAEDAQDIEIARLRLSEIASTPGILIQGKELSKRLARIKP